MSVNASQGIIVVYTSPKHPFKPIFGHPYALTASVKDTGTAQVVAAPPSPASQPHQAAVAALVKEAGQQQVSKPTQTRPPAEQVPAAEQRTQLAGGGPKHPSLPPAAVEDAHTAAAGNSSPTSVHRDS